MTEAWADASVAPDDHDVLGPCLRYERNGNEGGRIGALSNTFALSAGHTYLASFWLAPDPASNPSLEPLTLLLWESADWVYVPTDEVRQVQVLVTPDADVQAGQFELTPYPNCADRYWLDDVTVQEVAAEAYTNSAIVRFDETIPTGARSVFIYNDTTATQTVDLGDQRYVILDGDAVSSPVEVPGFFSVVLIPEQWFVSPSR